MIVAADRVIPGPELPASARRTGIILRLGGQVFRIVGVPANWLGLLSSRLLASSTAEAPNDCRTVTVELSRRQDLRPPGQPHDLNDSSKLVFEKDRVIYRSDGCEASFSRARGGAAKMLYYADAGPWFGGAIENLLRVVVAHDALHRGSVILHCAAIVRNGNAMVLFGHSGAGKSTTSAIALANGCSVISDDINLVEPAGRGWQVTPVPFSGTLNAASDIVRPVPLKGVFHLLKAGVDRVDPCTGARAIALLAGSAPFVNGDPYVSDRLMDVLGNLVQVVPVHDLYFTPAPAFLERIFGADE